MSEDMNSLNNQVSQEDDVSKTGKKSNTLVIALAAAIVVAAIALSVVLVSVAMKGKEANSNEPNYVLTSADNKTTQTESVDLQALLGGGEDESASEEAGGETPNNNAAQNNEPTKNTNETSPRDYYEQLSPNGENKLSDHYQNKYIKKISSKYEVDADLLVAIYSEPDTGNNFVLQFNGKTDDDGLIIKSPDTLEKVYHIDKDGKVSVATGKQTGNEGVSYAEGAVVFNMIKVIVMEQYPNYFTGLKD